MPVCAPADRDSGTCEDALEWRCLLGNYPGYPLGSVQGYPISRATAAVLALYNPELCLCSGFFTNDMFCLEEG